MAVDGRDDQPTGERLMKYLRLLFVVCACIFTSTAAQADDGGWLDWLYRLDTKLVGVGTDFHICFGEDGKFINCEDWFRKLFPYLLHRQIPEGADFSTIRHELDFRVGYYHKYGHGLSDTGSGSINALKLMALYHCHITRNWEVGSGAGVMPFFGSDFDSFSRGIVTPLSVVNGFPNSSATLRLDASYLTNELSGAKLGHPESTFFNNGEWSFSAAVGFDVRRIAVPKPKP
jgi:hypothetical protein